ncbi:MAG: hypothetical protein NZM17_04900 [Pyrinomonadaceae bacterium]|nr:hypothetical protein [Pyrinomonadaceae bacterium]
MNGRKKQLIGKAKARKRWQVAEVALSFSIFESYSVRDFLCREVV